MNNLLEKMESALLVAKCYGFKNTANALEGLIVQEQNPTIPCARLAYLQSKVAD